MENFTQVVSSISTQYHLIIEASSLRLLIKFRGYRLMVFPLIIQQRQNIAKQNNIAPELQRCQADLQAAIANKADQVEGIV